MSQTKTDIERAAELIATALGIECRLKESGLVQDARVWKISENLVHIDIKVPTAIDKIVVTVGPEAVRMVKEEELNQNEG